MAEEVLTFWFFETPPSRWWKAEPAFDAEIAERFGEVHAAALRGELEPWRRTPRGRLAEVIVIDQFSRNLHRGTPLAYAGDPMALVLAQEAIAGGHDHGLTNQERSFLYMPYMHSESRLIHEKSERLFASLEMPDNHDSALRHKAIVDRFGRYPHRNAVLGRESTPEEVEFLKQPGSAF